MFDKNFHFGFVKAELKSTTSTGVDIKTTGTHNTETSRVSGNLEAKHKFSDYGLTFTEKWDTNNILTTEVCIEEKLVKGFKQTFEAVLEPNTGKKSAKVKSQFKHDPLNVNVDLDFQSSMPVIQASTVFGYSGYLGGIQVGIDAGKQSVEKLNYAVGYSGKDFVMHGAVKNGSDFMASVYQQMSTGLEMAVNLSWASTTHDAKFGVAAKYNFDKSSFMKIKADNSSLIGCAYCFKIRDGVTMTLASQLDGKNINSGGHKLGLGLEFAA